MCSLPIKNRDKPNFVHILVYMILIDFINILYVYGFGHDEHVQTCSNMFKHVQTCSNMFKYVIRPTSISQVRQGPAERKLPKE